MDDHGDERRQIAEREVVGFPRANVEHGSEVREVRVAQPSEVRVGRKSARLREVGSYCGSGVPSGSSSLVGDMTTSSAGASAASAAAASAAASRSAASFVVISSQIARTRP